MIVARMMDILCAAMLRGPVNPKKKKEKN